MAELNTLPPSDVPMTKSGLIVNDVWYLFFNYLYRTLDDIINGTLINSVESGITATGTTQATAFAMTEDWNDFTVVAVNSGGRLMASTPGAQTAVFNSGANALRIYPPTGATIDALGVNNPYLLAINKMQVFHQLTATKFASTQLG